MVNFLGKMLVVLVAIMSTMFLGVAIAVFSTHKNWDATIKEQDALKKKLNEQQEQFATQYKLNDGNIQIELASAEYQVIKLERERINWVLRNQELEEQLAVLRQNKLDLTNNIDETQQKNKELLTKNQQLQDEIATTQKSIGVAFDETVRATSELHDAKLKLEVQLERNAQLVEQAGGTE